MRGAPPYGRQRRCSPRGSSPHMRGAHRELQGQQLHQGIIPAHAGSTTLRAAEEMFSEGIIPAHAGSTPRCRPPRPTRRDHPRTCGEHDQWALVCDRDDGSSPHMWGAPVRRRRRLRAQGIIPAHAGSTVHGGKRLADRWDHPRTCGKHADKVDQQVVDMGSSPHMRGALLGLPHAVYAARIIPAHAGSTGEMAPVLVAAWDHPRTCGEHRALCA